MSTSPGCYNGHLCPPGYIKKSIRSLEGKRMANFKQAYDETMGHEGGYVNDPADVGGETYKGIARKYHPSWEGWSIIDSLKGNSEFPKLLDRHSQLQRMVEKFYKQFYWDVNLLDHITNQNIATEMFDTGVNMGIGRAAKFLQQSCNYLNRNGKLFPDLVVDGKIGKKSLDALNVLLSNNEAVFVYKILNLLQGNHYLEYMTKSPTQERFARGWLKRVDFIKK
jgi:lysozyme family protein